jgi:hypothetical protein
MVFDATRGCTVLFGGAAVNSLFGDTWEWDGEYWTQVADTGPSARSRAAMAFDIAFSRGVLFGGDAGGGLLGDTWHWDGSDWTQFADTGPSARAGHAMCFDSDQIRTVLFGGRAAGGLSGDTWEWDGNEWTQIEDVGPPPREMHGLAYAPNHGRVVLFGGKDAGGVGLRDTWEWDGNRWTQVDDTGPDPRAGLSLAYGGATVALFGGVTGSEANPPKLFGDTWDWNGAHWTQRQDIGPRSRWLHGMAFDATRTHVVLFGGIASPSMAEPAAAGMLGDTWELTDTGAAAPGPRADVIVDVRGARTDSGSNGDTYYVDITTAHAPPAGGLPIHISLAAPAPPNATLRPRGTNAALPQPPLPGPPWIGTAPAGYVHCEVVLQVPSGAPLSQITVVAEADGDIKKLTLPYS